MVLAVSPAAGDPARIDSMASVPQSFLPSASLTVATRSSATPSSFWRIAFRSWSASFCAFSRAARACWRVVCASTRASRPRTFETAS